MANIQKRRGKRGTTYRVEFMHEGKRISKSFKTRKEADKFNSNLTLNNDFADGFTNAILSQMTLSEAVIEFLSKYTKKDQSIISRLNFWSESIGELTLNKVTRKQVKNQLNQLEKDGKAPATINRFKSNLSSLFSYINDEYDLKHNPCTEIKQKTENNESIRFLSEDELARLLVAAKNSSWRKMYLLILMAVTTGARRGELLSLTWPDIDFNKCEASIQDSKNGEPRVLPLTSAVINELLIFRQIGTNYIFHHPTYVKNYFRNFDYYWIKVVNESVVKDFRFHDLRHSCASFLAKNGATLLEIADVLGHKSISMTKRYSHLCTEHKASLINKVMKGVG